MSIERSLQRNQSKNRIEKEYSTKEKASNPSNVVKMVNKKNKCDSMGQRDDA